MVATRVDLGHVRAFMAGIGKVGRVDLNRPWPVVKGLHHPGPGLTRAKARAAGAAKEIGHSEIRGGALPQQTSHDRAPVERVVGRCAYASAVPCSDAVGNGRRRVSTGGAASVPDGQGERDDAL